MALLMDGVTLVTHKKYILEQVVSQVHGIQIGNMVAVQVLLGIIKARNLNFNIALLKSKKVTKIRYLFIIKTA